MNIAVRAQTKGFFYDFRRRFQANEQKFCVGSNRPNPLGGLYSIQALQADIEQNQIRLQLFGQLNGFQSVWHFPNYSELRPVLKPQTNKSAKSLMVFD